MARETTQSIDIGHALDLLAAAVEQRGEYFVHPFVSVSAQTCFHAVRNRPRCLVGQALALVGVRDSDLERLRDCGIRALYSEGRLPVRLTLGALVVFDAAQRVEDRGYAWGDALDYAADAATRYVDLVPDLLFASRAETAGTSKCAAS